MVSHPTPPTRSRPGRRGAAVVGAVGLSVVALVAAQSPASASSAAAAHPDVAKASGFVQTNLVSDQSGKAMLMDPNLVNPWGLSQGATSPLWVSDNGTDVTTLYSAGATGTTPTIIPLVVSIPGGAPTGQVFNDTPKFPLPDKTPAFFIFAGEDGFLSAWNPTQSPITSAVQVGKHTGSVFKGMALVHRSSGGPILLVADFHNGLVRAYGQRFRPISLPSWAFADPTLPAGYAPFNVASIGDRVFVSYAKQDADKGDDVAGPGHGFIDVYAENGMWLQRFASRGVLDSPWAMVIAPAGFGRFAGDLLVGNFGDGRIHAFNPWTGAMDGALRDPSGHRIAIDGLWGLLPGNGTTAPASSVWFSAGPDHEAHGLLGLLQVAAPPA